MSDIYHNDLHILYLLSLKKKVSDYIDGKSCFKFSKGQSAFELVAVVCVKFSFQFDAHGLAASAVEHGTMPTGLYADPPGFPIHTSRYVNIRLLHYRNTEVKICL